MSALDAKRKEAPVAIQAPSPLKFPRAQQYANHVYATGVVHRDNSMFLEEFVGHSSLLFARPMQLGKSTFFTLAEWFFSKKETAPPTHLLQYDPPAELKNRCYVLQLDFGAVQASRTGTASWEDVARRLDTSVHEQILLASGAFLRDHDDVKQALDSLSLPHPSNSGAVLEHIVAALRKVDKNAILMILLDEYDAPIREVIFDMLENRQGGHDFENKLKNTYANYVGFFKTCKTMAKRLPNSKVWLTGVTPIALDVLSGFNPDILTFDESVANAVGLLDADVDSMLEKVHQAMPFQDDQQKADVRNAIRVHFNGLMFHSGGPLYHTRMVNNLMEGCLLRRQQRDSWLADLSKPPFAAAVPERPPSSVFNVVKSARSLPRVMGALVANGEISGYELNPQWSLSRLMTGDIAPSDFLTLLVHLGILSVSPGESGSGSVFKYTSGVYRNAYVKPLLETSIGQLLECQSAHDAYSQGEDLIKDFLATLSSTSMLAMVDWAKTHRKNHILELQLQAFMVGELHNTIYPKAQVLQETVMPSKARTDITLMGVNIVVILELKEYEGGSPPSDNMKKEYHNQLRGYVEERKKMEASRPSVRPITGFVVVIYDNGRQYIVEKLS